MTEESQFCNKCDKVATKRCTRCKAVYYCTPKCQGEDYKAHQAVCRRMGKTLVSIDELEKKSYEEALQLAQVDLIPWLTKHHMIRIPPYGKNGKAEIFLKRGLLTLVITTSKGLVEKTTIYWLTLYDKADKFAPLKLRGKSEKYESWLPLRKKLESLLCVVSNPHGDSN